ncbi:McrB family protein [Mycoplasmopsis gallinacea]|uniref:5-methylcytosine-specific restriction enzyme B n=1 Tax=Mycoplasmopsis gallinacea TaxID=29556 RepID=A0A449A292_9BACT|nr:AAA family ATPase [Mycoplasmopsis gallinacea]VEU58324.1 5-methylcytosine-specific restriction enzyme B [Mycoplasmopsis gallinacea]
MSSKKEIIQINKIKDYLSQKSKIEEDAIRKITEIDWENVKSFYEKIQSNFKPHKLEKMSSEELLYKLFHETKGRKENLMYFLEYYGEIYKKPINKKPIDYMNEFFGSIKGSFADKAQPLQIIKSKDKKEIIFTRFKKEITKEEAIQITNDVHLFLKKVYEKSSNYNNYNLNNIDECIEFTKQIYNSIKEHKTWKFNENGWPFSLFERVWFRKYIHVMFPNIFSPYYNDNWSKYILDILFGDEANKWQEQEKFSKEEKEEISFMVNSILITNKIKSEFNLKNYEFIYCISNMDNEKEKNYVYVNKKGKENMAQTKENKNNTNKTGVNIIYYGAPGVGKSYKVQKEYDLDNKDKQVSFERVVFHPEYSYGDFVGQIKPDIKEENGNHLITYKFESGPFTKILKKAIEDQENHHYLIIEEINRGNAHSIFGDLFQLLDRDESGESEYEITNTDIAKEVYQDKNQKIKIPSNLTIIATMNTSDQNVYTLDTAFQRRWEMKHISNEFTKEEKEEELKNSQIFDTDVSWGDFLEVINGYILDNSSHMSSLEDKRIGKYFINKNDLNKKRIHYFAHKVLKYLWDDAFKLSRESVFKDEFKSLDSVIKTFVDDKNSGKERFKSIFNVEVQNKLSSK